MSGTRFGLFEGAFGGLGGAVVYRVAEVSGQALLAASRVKGGKRSGEVSVGVFVSS